MSYTIENMWDVRAMVARGIPFRDFVQGININRQVDVIFHTDPSELAEHADVVDEEIVEVVTKLRREGLEAPAIKRALASYVARAITEAQEWARGCPGCLFNQPGQVAHMSYGGCLYEDSESE
jgi:hypothetical protein